MKSRTGKFRLGVTALSLLTLSMVSIVAHAQGEQGGPPPGGGFGGQGRRGFGGPGGMMGRIQPVTAPVEVLTSELKLSAAQADKIKAIQTAYNKDRAALMPNRGGFGGPGGGPGGPGGGPGGPGGGPAGGPPEAPGFEGDAPTGHGPYVQGQGQGGPGGPGGQGGFQAMREKMDALDKAANDKIMAVLTEEQKAALPGVIQMIGAFQAAGVQPPALVSLKPTADQKKKAITISKDMQQSMQQAMQNQDRDAMMDARAKAHDKIMALLTSEQKTALDKFNKEHPQRGFGGPGGPGGFGGPGGGPGGPGGGPGGAGGDGPPPPPQF